jgi:hypothetical protein
VLNACEPIFIRSSRTVDPVSVRVHGGILPPRKEEAMEDGREMGIMA